MPVIKNNKAKIKPFVQIAFAILFLTGLWNLPYSEIRIERCRAFGEKTTVGTVTHRKTTLSGEARHYLISYSFVGPFGIRRDKTAKVNKKTWKRYLGGDSIQVIYPVAEPSFSRIKGEVESPLVRFLASFSRKKH